MRRKPIYSRCYHRLPTIINFNSMVKNIQYFVKFSLGILVVIAWQSCTEKIDIKLEHTSVRCLIYGEITTDTTAHKVRITRSADYFSNKPAEPVSGATLNVTGGTSTFHLTESLTEPGNYYTNSDVYGISGKTYTLNVSNVDLLGDGNMKSYTASSELKPVSKTDSIDAEYNSRWNMWEIKAWTKDPKETEDYYMFKVYINGVLNADSLTNLVIAEDKLFNGNYTNGITVYMVEGNDTIKADDIITLDICGINQDYFKFITEAQTMVNPQNPMFSGPPANTRTNLNNEAIGYFTAYSIASSSCRIKPSRK